MTIKRRLSTAFHPESDGQTERTNQTLEAYLRCYINHEQDDWAALLGSAEFAMNNARSETTKHTPFELVFQKAPSMRLNIQREPLESGNASAEVKAAKLKAISQELADAWEKSRASTARWYDSHRKAREYAPGTKVMLASKYIKLRRVSKKLADKMLGPFEVEKRIGQNAYKLKLPTKYQRIHPVFHVSLLEEYRQRPGVEPPEAVDIEGEDEWEVEKILTVRGTGNRR